MPQKYFDKFPTITYSNTQAVDITRRVAPLDQALTTPYVYYPYEIVDEERPDQLSHRYYKDSYRSWIFYLTNKMIDPYYEWYLTENQFSEFIDKKYGSVYDAQRKVKYYRNNWSNSDPIIVSEYNALTDEMKNYWVPNLGSGNQILSYSRKQVDWKTNTNKIIRYKVSNTNFIIDEICDVVFDDYNSGRGQVVAINTDTANTANNDLYLQHVSGEFYTSNTVQIISNVSYIYGRESQVNTFFTSVYSVANNILDEVEVYWSPVSYFDYELEKNEFNKTITILDSNYKQTIVDNLKDLLSQ